MRYVLHHAGDAAVPLGNPADVPWLPVDVPLVQRVPDCVDAGNKTIDGAEVGFALGWRFLVGKDVVSSKQGQTS